MHHPTVAAALLSLVLVQGVSAQIDPGRMERNLRTLAADDMQGRAAGTEHARKAAAFLAAQFKEAGLQPYAGHTDFLAGFQVTRVVPESRTLMLNGTQIPDEDFAIMSDRPSDEVTDPAALKVFVFPEGAPLGPVFGQARAHQGPKALLIHPAHRAQVAGFMPYLKRPITMEEGDTHSPVSLIVITDQTEITSVEARATNTLTPTDMANVAGVLPGTSKPEEIVLFSAHYDHLGTIAAVDGDTIANGADDDASGTVALIELAHHFKKVGHARTLIFVAFTAEELGGFGSKNFSNHIDARSITAMINIEMIGKPSQWGPGQGFITGYEHSSLPALLAEASGTPPVLHPDPYVAENLFLRSDNATLARMGVPAHSVSSSKINEDPYYHTVNDEVETLDMAHLTELIRAIARGAAPIVDGTATPTRIDPAKIGRGPM